MLCLLFESYAYIYLNYSNSCVVLLVVSVEQEKLTKNSRAMCRKFFKHINSKVVKEILNLFNF